MKMFTVAYKMLYINLFVRVFIISQDRRIVRKTYQRKNVHFIDIQVNLIITLSLGSMKTDRVISEPCYNEVIYNRHIAKLIIWEP